MIGAQQVRRYVNDKAKIEQWCETVLQAAIIDAIDEDGTVDSITISSHDLPNCYQSVVVQISMLTKYVKEWGYDVKIVDAKDKANISIKILW